MVVLPDSFLSFMILVGRYYKANSRVQVEMMTFDALFWHMKKTTLLHVSFTFHIIQDFEGLGYYHACFGNSARSTVVSVVNNFSISCKLTNIIWNLQYQALALPAYDQVANTRPKAISYMDCLHSRSRGFFEIHVHITDKTGLIQYHRNSAWHRSAGPGSVWLS